MSDPAAAPLISGLVPAAVRVSESPLSAVNTDAWTLSADEAQAIENAVATRRHEFIAGRILARRALESIGVRPQPIPVGPNRAPIWPAGVTGSISHTKTWCAVAVASTASVPAIGIDVEASGAVAHDLWSTIYTPDEIEWLRAHPQPDVSKVIFSAKESIFKAAYAATGVRLGMMAVSMRVGESDWRATFRVECGDRFRPGDSIVGRWGTSPGLVGTVTTLATG